MPRRRFIERVTSRFGDYAALQEYYDRPVAFAREQLRIEPWARQRDILRAVAEHVRVTVRSGQKVGKSLSAIILALWWVATRGPRSSVWMTAPTRRQVRDPLWKEIKFLYPRISHKLKGPRILPRDPETGIELPGQRYIKGATGSQPEKMAGISAPSLLFIVDEATGIADDMWMTVAGNMASDARVIAFSNPTKPVGWWADACESDEWCNLHVSSLESPNIVEGADIVPGLAKPGWARWMEKEYGRDSPGYKVRVLGEFPDQTDNQIVATALVNLGIARWLVNGFEQSDEPLAIGVDPAAKGSDPAVIQPVRGHHAYLPTVMQGMLEPEQIAAATMEALDRYRMPWDGVTVINVDSVAIGLGTVAALRACPGYGKRFVVRALNGGELAEKHRRGVDFNLRTQMWFQLRKWLKEGGTLPPTVKGLKKEILAQTYSIDGQRRNVATGKEIMRKVLKHSPNHADALCLAIHPGKPSPSADEWLFASDLEEEDDYVGKQTWL